MDTIYYLVHITDKYNPEWKELKTSKIEDFEDQFPGVYLSLITKDNITTNKLYFGKYILIFSKKLLEQKNYHINLRDYNGFISENNTYFPWNLDKAVQKLNETNEVIFHDPIPMNYLCAVINLLSPLISINTILPHIQIENEIEPDMTKEPFYCFPLEKNYTGIDPLPESSRDFFVNMAKNCNVNINLPTNEIINKIKEKIPYLYKNRNKQQINILKMSSRARGKGRGKFKLHKNKTKKYK